MIYIVIFLVSTNRYYISKTFNPDITKPEEKHPWFNNQFENRVVEVIPNCKESDVDKYTKIYIEKYGVGAVRGGSFISLNDEDIVKQLEDIKKLEENKDEITNEIEQLQNKILELERIQKQKEIDEENAKKGTFDYYFQQLFEFIQIKKEREINRNNYDVNGNPNPNARTSKDALPYAWSSGEDKRVSMVIKENKELVPALESIYSSLDIINKRLIKLENN